ncbi:D-alanyl-D-alanine carboxypeptidase family protein [Magnetospirillum molischianum]|uniref:serine-type D-Ala-D-Ala carboxypeptidase n=1 Tax=Magnetospirillum molischianum DSM 120 TaxID=1150626 RepID=H8FXQ8_MAGML|nr:D-alanyl-D-alanine carboxypeptidase family protein [Magnetospirillum molischianum]CCG43146.1 putative Serine-type D-Ala-D-Ala carboxypeptidase [Magnetospirillum molischianum DSM 120]
MLPLFRRSLLAAIVAAGLGLDNVASAQSIDTSARQAIITDFDTGTVMMEKNADELMVPSSMSKLMTVFMVFEKVKSGAWKPDDALPVSETAWKRHYKSDGSMMFLPVNSTATVDELLKGVVIQSGNDACSVLAEAHSGSEEAFAEAMTRRARQIGLTRSTFRNASGWPEPDHMMTARDLSVLARHLIADFPDYYPLFSQMEFVFNGIRQGNRNPLLYGTPGADGLKTGHTQAAGFGLTASIKRGDRRIVMVLNGLGSMQQRADESRRLAEWAFREWDRYPLFRAGEVVIPDAPVWMGEARTVSLVAKSDLAVTLPRRARADMKVSVVFNGPIPSPVKAGTEIGKVVVTAPGLSPLEMPLVAAADVARLGFGGRLAETIRSFFSGS